LARQSFEFSIGDTVHILSDKAFRRSKENRFEAVGNVIITQKDNAIYGEKASISFNTGETDVIGNVRYIGPTMTLYGSELNYNFNNRSFSVKNARLLSDNYVVLGKELNKISDNVITGKDAEYTTCRDCPESWSIFGRDVHITVGEYIRIKHAFLKVKGVVMMYVPYMVLPIKKNRETGLLFPNFGLDLDEGARFQQPWFWAISPSTDMTITPGVFGKRGWVGDFQFRQIFADGLWYEVNSLTANDRIYSPNKDSKDVSGGHAFRQLSEWEHHYNSGENFNHHFYFNSVNDLDMAGDFDTYNNQKAEGSSYGGGGFFDARSNYFSLSLESSFYRNQIFDKSKGFDHRYVQTIPKVSVNTIPVRLFQSEKPLLNKVSVGMEGDMTIFKQNHVQEGNFIRNATRYNLAPYLDWNMGNIGPGLAKSKIKLDYQHYRFPTHPDSPAFTKRGLVYESEYTVEIEKLFGLSYEEKIPMERVRVKEKKEDDSKGVYQKVVGELPSLAPGIEKDYYLVKKNSYRHGQEFKVKHFFLTDQKSGGNGTWATQIEDEAGQFDPIDAIREKEIQLTNEVSRTSLPLNNTLEFQWNNSLIKKTVKESYSLGSGADLREDFSYSRVSYFNVSQGYDLNIETNKESDRLTRLFVATGINFKKSYLSASEYYFYNTHENIFYIATGRQFDYGRIDSSLRYESINTPITKYFILKGTLNVTDLFQLNAGWEYNIETKETARIRYGLTYSPANNCWRVIIGQSRNLRDRGDIEFNFLINYNGKGFTGLNEL
jgi:LPS-assembly protein